MAVGKPVAIFLFKTNPLKYSNLLHHHHFVKVLWLQVLIGQFLQLFS